MSQRDSWMLVLVYLMGVGFVALTFGLGITVNYAGYTHTQVSMPILATICSALFLIFTYISYLLFRER